MANQWFRLYAEFATDPKVQMMSEAYQRRYIMLLCLRCCNGAVTLHETEVAFQMRISEQEWAETKAVFLKKGLIDEDNKPAAWDRRQFVSDSSAPRVAAYRARKKAEEKTGEQPCNVTVTPPDTDTDTDTDTERVNTTCAEPVHVSPPSAKIVRPSFDFSTGRFSGISASTRENWAEAYPAIDARSEIAKAAAWLMANPKNRKSDYLRFLNSWLSRAQDSARPVAKQQRPASGRQAIIDNYAAQAAEARKRDGNGSAKVERDITAEVIRIA